jgi:hypothetical protein
MWTLAQVQVESPPPAFGSDPYDWFTMIIALLAVVLVFHLLVRAPRIIAQQQQHQKRIV